MGAVNPSQVKPGDAIRADNHNLVVEQLRKQQLVSMDGFTLLQTSGGVAGRRITQTPRRQESSLASDPAFYVYQTGTSDVGSTAGNVQFPNASATAVTAVTGVAVTNGDTVYLQRALDGAFSFKASATAPTIAAYFPLATIGTDGSSITAITRSWAGGDIQWPSTELHWDIPVPENDTYTLILHAAQRLVVDKLVAQMDGGSCTVNIKIEGTSITGLSAVNVTTGESTTESTGACVCNPGETITVVVTSASSPDHLKLSLLFL
jgi:hypothetical protein